MARPAAIVIFLGAGLLFLCFGYRQVFYTEAGFEAVALRCLLGAAGLAVIGALFWTLADIHRALITRSETS